MDLHLGLKDVGCVAKIWEPHILNVKTIEGLSGHGSEKKMSGNA